MTLSELLAKITDETSIIAVTYENMRWMDTVPNVKSAIEAYQKHSDPEVDLMGMNADYSNRGAAYGQEPISYAIRVLPTARTTDVDDLINEVTTTEEKPAETSPETPPSTGGDSGSNPDTE